MPRLNYQQVAQLAWNAGWRGKDAQTAVAIARAESQFDTMATNFKGRDHSYGLWQVNMMNEMGPERRQKFGLTANEQLFDPATNARVAYGLWKERGGFTDWSTYNDQKYQLYLNGAVFAIKQIEQGKTGTEIPSYDASNIPAGQDSYGSQSIIPNPLDGIKDIAGFVTNKENWFRAAAVLGGVILIVLAIALVASDTLISQALKRVGKAGKVVKAVT
jgi:hypothetical protein